MTLTLQDIVFVPSVQHTGTWFTIDFLRNFFPNVKELPFILEPAIKPGMADVAYQPTYSESLEQRTVIHTHLPIVRYLNMGTNWPTSRFYKRWYANLGTLRSSSIEEVLTLCNFFKTVIPIRDPLAAILTREARHPQLNHFFIVDGFVVLATEFVKHPNVMFLPIDLVDTTEERIELLIKVANHVGVDNEVNKDVIIAYAERWKPANPTPNNRFRQLYKTGNISEIRKLLGSKWAEVTYLQNMASVILPFLANLGYTKGKLNLW